MAEPTNEKEPPLMLPVTEAARLCGLCVRTLWRLVSTGKAPQPVRIGRRTLWRRADLLDFVAGLIPGTKLEIA